MSNLLNDTRELLRTAPRTMTLAKIAKQTDLHVSWLSAFANDKMRDPGCVKVQVLHDFLASQSKTGAA